MKNSNIQWIGEIPDGWEVSKFKYVSTIYTGNSIKDEHKSNYESSEDARPYISSKDIDVHTGNVDYNNGLYIKKDDSTFRVARKGCSLMCIEGGSAGKKKALINQDVSFVNKLCCFQSNDKIDERFLYYYLCNPSYEEEFRNNISGMIGGVSVSVLKNFVILVPPLATQTSIATYLDTKCSEIDGLIADINKQIETLNELKKSTITEAVTKGLNKNAKLKDSGIQWIGMIPEGWRVTKVKYIVENPLQYGATESGVDFDDKLPRYIRITDIIDNRLKDEGKLSLTELQSKGFILKDNDILFARSGGTVGKTFIYRQKYGKSAFAGYLIRATISKSNNADFVYYYTLSNCYDNWKSMIFTQATIQNIGADKYNNLLISLPPLAEQRAIATYLDSKCTEFDSIISDKQKQISTLEAYKKSLIYEYVTGKKKVE